MNIKGAVKNMNAFRVLECVEWKSQMKNTNSPAANYKIESVHLVGCRIVLLVFSLSKINRRSK